ncbi:hypothetical protein YC2023_123481 [Brassica napus]
MQFGQLQSVQIISVTTRCFISFPLPPQLKIRQKLQKSCAPKLKRFNNVPTFFVAEIPDSITRLLTPLSLLWARRLTPNLELQEKILTDIGQHLVY